MLNGGLTIYAEFIDAMSLFGYAWMMTCCHQRMSQLATGQAVSTINIICVRFNTAVTQKP